MTPPRKRPPASAAMPAPASNNQARPEGRGYFLINAWSSSTPGPLDPDLLERPGVNPDFRLTAWVLVDRENVGEQVRILLARQRSRCVIGHRQPYQIEEVADRPAVPSFR